MRYEKSLLFCSAFACFCRMFSTFLNVVWVCWCERNGLNRRFVCCLWLFKVVVYCRWKYDLRFLFYADDRLVCGAFPSMCVRGFVDNDGIFNLVRYFCRFTMWWRRVYMAVWRRMTISCDKVCFSCVRAIVLRPKKPLFSGVSRRTKFPHINISTSKIDAVQNVR